MTGSRGRARFGVLVPFTNTNLEPDMALLRPDGVSMHFARMGGYDADEIPDASQMQSLGSSDLEDPLRLLSGVKPDVVLYGCTSATLTHGPAFDQALTERIASDSGALTVTAAGALVAALSALGVTRIGFASPYVPAINDVAISFLADFGVQTVPGWEPLATRRHAWAFRHKMGNGTTNKQTFAHIVSCRFFVACLTCSVSISLWPTQSGSEEGEGRRTGKSHDDG